MSNAQCSMFNGFSVRDLGIALGSEQPRIKRDAAKVSCEMVFRNLDSWF